MHGGEVLVVERERWGEGLTEGRTEGRADRQAGRPPSGAKDAGKGEQRRRSALGSSADSVREQGRGPGAALTATASVSVRASMMRRRALAANDRRPKTLAPPLAPAAPATPATARSPFLHARAR